MVLRKVPFGMSNSADASPSRQITVVDVYDLASAIGKDFEKLIDQYGTECVRNLMPKVISSLETLEALASRNERENEEICSLKLTLDRMEMEKQEKKEGKLKFEQELEQIEENYRAEIQELWSMITKLQEDNKRLSASIELQDPTSPIQCLKEDDIKMMLSLKEQVDTQRDQIKSITRENDDRQQELDTVSGDVEKLRRVNKELQRKNKAIQNQSRVLVEEKAELISQLQKCEVHLIDLEHKLGETEKAKKDLEQTKAEESSGENTPRFTLAELREVLQEKNTLKARVMELEEELELLRPPPNPSPLPPTDNDDEAVVYGPINKEPDDKLYPWKYSRRDSGVRKFFSRFRRQKEKESPSKEMDATSECSSSSFNDPFVSDSSSRNRAAGRVPHDPQLSLKTPPSLPHPIPEYTEAPIEFSLDKYSSGNYATEAVKRRIELTTSISHLFPTPNSM